MHNTIDIVANAEYCLVYDKPILSKGLSWGDLVIWWQEKNSQVAYQIEQNLYSRLEASLKYLAEKFLFNVYYNLFNEILAEKLPALIPQIYFYYDPKTLEDIQMLRERYEQERPSFPIQRIDFLILFSDKDRVIIEIDGKQHYSCEEEIMVKTNGKYHLAKKSIAIPEKYATLASEDRKLQLRGYEIYRFGGYELCGPDNKGQLAIKDTAEKVLNEFFLSLFDKHGIPLK